MGITGMLRYVYGMVLESPWGLLCVLMVILTIVLALIFPEAKY